MCFPLDLVFFDACRDHASHGLSLSLPFVARRVFLFVSVLCHRRPWNFSFLWSPCWLSGKLTGAPSSEFCHEILFAQQCWEFQCFLQRYIQCQARTRAPVEFLCDVCERIHVQAVIVNALSATCVSISLSLSIRSPFRR